MRNQKLCKERSKHYVPEDLWPVILCRLPVKSLLRFRSVSKSWLALIDDPEFARIHLKNFKNNADETHLLVVQTSRRECVVRCSETFEADSGIIHTLGSVLHPGSKGDIICSVDGLILLSTVSESLTSSDCIWNPSIRKFHEIPSLTKLDASPSTKLLCFAIGLGYDVVAQDYKIVKLVFVNDNTFQSEILHSVAIFSLGANSWKIIKAQDMGGFNWPWRLKHSYQGLYFRGCLYCIAGVMDLVSFDLSSELLSSISLPNVRRRNHFLNEWEHVKCEKLTLLDGGRTMAAFYTCEEESSIWVLDTESKNWARRYTFKLKSSNNVLYLKNNGDILVKRGRTKRVATENTEEQMVVWLDQVRSYSPRTDEYKILQEENSPYYMICDVYGCTESLILHK